MSTGGFGGRGKDLEEQFFRQRDMELLKAFRAKAAEKEKREALSEASGIFEEELLDQLIDLDVSAETLAALGLIPLVAVAWADGHMDDKERDAILAAAQQKGVQQEHPGYELLQGWLKRKPDPALMTVWKGYVKALAESLDEEARNTLKEDLLGRARTVAETAGGLLGFGNKVSKAEQAVLSELETAFD